MLLYMYLKYLLALIPFIVAILAHDDSNLIAKTPPCALTCSINLLSSICDLSQISSCLCVNETLQAELSICVQKSCIWSDQLVAATVENELCAGYPEQDKSAHVRAISIAFFCTTIPFLGLRLFARWKVAGELFTDDWAVMVACFWVVVGAGLEITASEKGFGKHYWNVPVENAELLLKLFYALQIVYIIIQVSAKASLLLLYHRIFPDERFKRIVQACMAFVGLHGVIFIIVILFQCLPLASIWNHAIEGHCANLQAIAYAGAAFSILEDLVILVLPLPQLNTLSLPLNKKLGLMLMFSVGSFACVTSMVRLKFIAQVSTTYDISWTNVNILIWSVMEVDVTLICACLPALRPLILQYIPGLYKSAISTTKSTWNGSYRMRKWRSMNELRPNPQLPKSSSAIGVQAEYV
ncbi:uncharacterized protein LY89DRAFT_787162 [Mollisia scopiformis]|uniref:CFEM domain-containing protein n=1 Tax=Mollisia scopiformis TaxID=149040 RepID=A0A194WT33_MOLSC|nr:uncharacterized protein LY89DRAFT_787162 [Mollisia scopiformis]KUJ10782.1 hypothetical protein LY89DRAFT_787162 [Mollisia scopiformis]